MVGNLQKLFLALLIGLFAGIIISIAVIHPRINETDKNNKLTHKPKLFTKNQQRVKQVRKTPANQLTSKITSLNIASYYPLKTPVYSKLIKRLETEVAGLSNKRLMLAVKNTHELVPPDKIFNAVQSGTIQAGFSSPKNWISNIPALQLFSSVPFNYSPREFLAWFYEGGGEKIYKSLYEKRNIHALLCGVTSIHGPSWFTTAILNLKHFKNMTIRADGLTAQILGELGLRIQSETKTISAPVQIDGGLYSLLNPPAHNKSSRHGNFYYLPGWHEPITLFELLINKSKWKSLNDFEKKQLKVVCGDNIRFGLSLSDSYHIKNLKELIKNNVKIKKWPKEILSGLNEAWIKIVEKKSLKDIDFRNTYASLKYFKDEFSIWQELEK